MSYKDDVTTRPIANFPPDIWGDQFLVYEEEEENGVEKEIENLRKIVRNEMLTSLEIPSQHTGLLKLIDAIQRLGIAYYFEENIILVLQHMYETYGDKGTGANTPLWFRLMRQQGIFISSDIFNIYKDTNGAFKASLKCDVQELIELYEATYLRVHGESILDELLDFTRTCLADLIKDPLMRNSTVFTQVEEVLKQPLHRRLPRIEALRYIPFYQQEVSHNESLLKLAKLGFNLLQSLHKRELSQICKWWKIFDIPNNIPYVRNRPVECYFWALAVYFEPQYSITRVFLARFMVLQTHLDDTYDAYGSYEELKQFTAEFQRWSNTCSDELPVNMKLIYRMLMILLKEMEEILSKDGKAYHLNYLKDVVKEYIQSYMTEAKWKHEEYTPTMEEHIKVSYISIGYKCAFNAGFLSMGDIITPDTFKWAMSNPPIVNACNALCRIIDDMAGHKEEQDRDHVASGVEVYMKQFDISEQEAYEVYTNRVEDAWKEINKELMTCKDVKIPIIARVLNFARSTGVIFKNGDNFTRVGDEFKNHIKSLLVDPMDNAICRWRVVARKEPTVDFVGF